MQLKRDKNNSIHQKRIHPKEDKFDQIPTLPKLIVSIPALVAENIDALTFFISVKRLFLEIEKLSSNFFS